VGIALCPQHYGHRNGNAAVLHLEHFLTLFLVLFTAFFAGFQLPFQDRQWLRRWQGYHAILCCSIHTFVSCSSKSQLQRWRSAYGERETCGDADQRGGPVALKQVQLQRAISVHCTLSKALPPPPPCSRSYPQPYLFEVCLSRSVLTHLSQARQLEMSAQESTAEAGRVLTHAHTSELRASSDRQVIEAAAAADSACDFDWGEVDSTSSGLSFSDSDNDLLSKAVTAGASPPLLPCPHLT
jgi:hypothetical protein